MRIAQGQDGKVVKHAKMAVAGLILAGLLAGIVGCNTTEGAGRDIKSAGKGIEEAAQENKPK